MKLGITLNDKDFTLIKKWADLQGITPTTFCRLLITSQAHYYERNKVVPKVYQTVMIDLSEKNEKSLDNKKFSDILPEEKEDKEDDDFLPF